VRAKPALDAWRDTIDGWLLADLDAPRRHSCLPVWADKRPSQGSPLSRAPKASDSGPLTDIPWLIPSSNEGLRVGVVVLPRGVLVVEGARFEAAMKDADKPVGELPQSGMVAYSAGAECVVVRPGACRSTEGAECLQV
jgi:hypothetical protein